MKRWWFHPPAFWYPGEGAATPLAARMLSPLAGAVTRRGRRRRERAPPQEVGAPLVCVGNVTTGGTGKTPIALALGAHFLEQGRNAHFLCRGYGGTARGVVRVAPRRHEAGEVGDEALELASAAPCWAARDRLAGARAAAEAGAGVVVLDDGLQTPGLRYDLSLLVVDGARGLGNGCVLPAGPLREPWEDAVGRSDLVLVVGEARQERLREALARCDPAMVFRVDMRVSLLEAGGEPVGRLLAFCGIGHPERFRAGLRERGEDVAELRVFPDHYFYGEREAVALLRESERLGARLVTTRKDAVRLAGAAPGSARRELYDAVLVARVSARLEEPERFGMCVDAFLAARMRKKKMRGA